MYLRIARDVYPSVRKAKVPRIDSKVASTEVTGFNELGITIKDCFAHRRCLG